MRLFVSVGWTQTTIAYLEELQQSIEPKLESIGFGPEHRAFRAHITLATGVSGCL